MGGVWRCFIRDFCTAKASDVHAVDAQREASCAKALEASAALAHGIFAAIAGSVFFSLCLFLATAFSDVWRPLLITLAIAGLIGLGEIFFHDQLSFGLIRTMSGEAYHETGAVPWLGLAFSAVLSGGLIWAAILNLERRDF